MENFWEPQVRRAKLIRSCLLTNSETDTTLDFGAAGMIRDDKMSLHKHLVDNVPGKVIGVDARESDYTDIKHDFNNLPYPFKDESINNIVAGEVIEHLHNPYLFLKECYRILKYKGRLILTTPSAEGIQLLMGRESPWHYYIWTLKDFELLAKAAGFRVVWGTRINIYYNKNLLLRGLGYIIPKLRPTLFFILEKENENSNTN